MEYSNKLQLSDILKDMPPYVILRVPEHFPNYYANTDVDILCQSLYDCTDYLQSKLSLSANVISDKQVHLDRFDDGKLDIKFDLYERYISDEYKEKALLHSMKMGDVYTNSFHMDAIAKCYELLVNGKEKYRRYEHYKYYLNDYITL